MNAEDTAKELVRDFRSEFDESNFHILDAHVIDKDYEKTYEIEMHFVSKQCALVAVNVILKGFGLRIQGKEFYTSSYTIEFWKDVKTEIEKL